MAATSFILNGLFFIVLARNKDLVKRKRITYHVANLAIADTLFGLSRIFYFIIRLLHPNEIAILLHLDSMCAGFQLASVIAVLLMTIERSVVIAKPLTWSTILPRKRILLIMIGSWIAVTLLAVLYNMFWKIDMSDGMVIFILPPVFILFTAAVNIFMFKKLREKDGLADSQQSTRVVPQTATHYKSTHLKHKASILVLWLAVIMIITCLPMSLQRMIILICLKYKLHYNWHLPYQINRVIFILEDLNFLVNPLVYIWKDRIYRNAFYRTLKIKAQF